MHQIGSTRHISSLPCNAVSYPYDFALNNQKPMVLDKYQLEICMSRPVTGRGERTDTGP